MLGSALGEAGHSQGPQGGEAVAQLIGIPPVPCGRPSPPIPKITSPVPSVVLSLPCLDLPSSPGPRPSALKSPKPSFQDPLSGR